MKRFSEFLNERGQLLLEMAKIGEIDHFEVIIWTNDSGRIPHVHIVSPEFDCCVRLDKPEYFKHGHHTDTLNSRQRKAFYEFMCSTQEEGDTLTNYEFAVRNWNTNNSETKIKIPRDDTGRIIIPDYRLLP